MRRTTTNVNLWQSASSASVKVTLIHAGTLVNVLTCDVEWCRVIWSGHSRYVAQPYLR